jgi:hypothetical protein
VTSFGGGLGGMLDPRRRRQFSRSHVVVAARVPQAVAKRAADETSRADFAT